MATLDRTRHYGENFGFVENGAKYVQDGKDFDASGNEIVSEPVVEPVEPELEPVVEPIAETVLEQDVITEEPVAEPVVEPVTEVKHNKRAKKAVTTADLI